MSDLHRARARAEAFAHAVDHGPRHSSRTSDDPELATAVELAGRLRAAGAVTPRPEFVADLRQRLLEQAAARAATHTPTVVRSSGPDASDDHPPREDDASVTEIGSRRRRRIGLIASTAALVLLGGGIGSAAAAQQALPGDALYGMKRSIENVSTNVSVGDDSRGRRELDHAMTRLEEVRRLAQQGADVAIINQTLDDFSIQARRGVTRLVASYQQTEDKSAITAITTFITAARTKLAELSPLLPSESLKAAVEALATIDQLARHTVVACPDCDKPKPVEGSGPVKVSTPDSNSSVEPGGQPSTGTLPTLPPLQSTAKPTPSLQSTERAQSTSTATPVIPQDLTTIQATPKDTNSNPSNTTTPSLPTPSLPTPKWSWPFPTLSLPLPSLPLLPPWK